MEPLIVLAVTFVLLWLLFILPQQRRVRAHQALVDSVQPGDHVILSAGIFGRIVEIGPEEMTLEVAPGVVLRVARQAVLRHVEDVTDLDVGEPTGDVAAPADESGEQAEGTAHPGDTAGPGGTVRPGGESGGTHPGGTEPNPES